MVEVASRCSRNNFASRAPAIVESLVMPLDCVRVLGDRVVCQAYEGFDMIKQNGETMIRSNSKTAMPDKILQQVHDVQRSSRFRDRLYAWLIAGGVLATLMIVAMIVESQLNLFSHTLRFVLTIASLVATVVCGWIFWQRGKRQNERLVSAAEQVDSTFPVLEQRVSTLTSCEGSDSIPSSPLTRRCSIAWQSKHLASMKTSNLNRLFQRKFSSDRCAGSLLSGWYFWVCSCAVSYTHLTLPTIYSV